METPRPKQDKTPEGNTKHYSVGALIRDTQDRILLIDRAEAPFGFACVAGHVDEGETFEHALMREVKEEVGLTIQSYRLLAQEWIPWNWCHHGITGHEWEIFECTVAGELADNPLEVRSIRWYTREEIRELKLEEIWEYWFKKLNILESNP